MPKKPRVPPLTPAPTYGPRGKPYKPPKAKGKGGDLPTFDLSPRHRLGRLLKFRKGGYTKKT